MTTPEPADRVLARASLAEGSPTAWFDRLYTAAARGEAEVPWTRGTPNADLAAWVRPGEGRRALVVGSALGDDAELLSAAGWAVTAFDVAPAAVDAARARFPESRADYVVADLLHPPGEWRRAFDLVVEIINIQAMPRDFRPAAVTSLAGFLAPGGTLLVSEVAEESTEAETWEGPPWPFSRAEIESIAQDGVRLVSLDTIREGTRYWATFTR
ncbi:MULTISPECIES: methyltransferase domain-containing protein [unclassified Amycolatopsis]|uniref:class I SAM-dependent methyltransferase n=1 Tax=unclassified Amycolatopsis TaxID=2618356 RepID=UPI0028740E80|nr:MULTISPECIES: methyltransferase domain-containing protein [unclassified Amycolatopsis]MDS0136717.1 methyltransferase domain-containing protein [Amycolatopsis sp. 505]MDS0143382.1 methyltransferase domain-containing protein [Amycolatopsis sp. CM201R]